MRFSSAAKAALVLSVLAGVACTQKDPKQSLQAAQAAIQKRDYKAATIEIKNALQRDAGLAEARFMLGTVLALEGNNTAAEVELRKALSAGHPGTKVVPELAKALLAMGQYKKIVDEFSATKLDDPAAQASLLTSLAQAHGGMGKRELAKSTMDKALAAVPDYPQALLVQAQFQAADGDRAAALTTVGKVLAADAANPVAWKLKGDLEVATGAKGGQAKASYQKSVEVDPKFAPGFAALLVLNLAEGKLDDAAKDLEALKRVAPRSSFTKLLEARVEFQRRDYKRARDLLRQLVVAAPKNAAVLQLAGATEFQLNSLPQAESYLEASLKIAPDNGLTRRLLIGTYLRSGQANKALVALQAIPEKAEMDASMLSLAGEVHLQNGDAKKAEAFFAKALKLEPDNLGRRTSLALSQLATGQANAAFDALENIAQSDQGVTADMALISAHLTRKEYAKALVAIDKLEAKQPNKPVAAELRGRTMRAMNDPVGARKSFEKALQIDPLHFSAASSLAALDLAEQKPQDARARFEAILAKEPKHAQALLALAQLASGSGGKKEEVIALLARAVDANPTDERPRLRLIDQHLRSNDLKQAMSSARDATAALPNSVDILDALGTVQMRSGEVNQAIATFTKVSTMLPLSPMPHLRLAAAHEANKDMASAEQSVQKALEIKPDLLETQRALILLQIKAKKFAEALKVAKTVQQQRPKSQVGYAYEAEVFAAQSNWDPAIAAYRKALEQAATPDLAIKLNMVLQTAGKSAEATTQAQAWMKEHPKDPNFPQFLGTVAIGKKDFASAEKHLQTVLQLQPNNAVALNNLAYVAGQLKRPNAVELAEKALRLAPDQPPFLDTLAMLLLDQKEFDKALKTQTRAVELQPDSGFLRLNLAKILAASGDKPRAKAELEKIKPSNNKDDPLQKEVTALMSSLR
ncbi:putative PEP-CTERM system TPR-repeat lipoprotein [Burkholderiales bacterium JOSHI_001]|nr:putative PEP-CTERM system TPR-repeat lipoprotein [Burkholderiales bacterium JOSHI_001]